MTGREAIPQVAEAPARSRNAIANGSDMDAASDRPPIAIAVGATTVVGFERVEASIFCEGPTGEVEIAVPAGASLRVQVEPFGDDLPLLTGALPLVTSMGGFVRDTGGSVVAPELPRVHTWSFVGPDSEPLTLRVFRPEEVTIAMQPAVPQPLPDFGTLEVGATLGGARVCRFDPRLPLVARVASGDCTNDANRAAPRSAAM